MNPDILIFSRGSNLLPVGFRLSNEGELDVQTYLTDPEDRGLWFGTTPGLPSDLGPHIRECEAGVPVLTNDPGLQTLLRNSPNLYGTYWDEPRPTSGLRLGFWFDGTQAHAHHGLIVDQGLWPGGLGYPQDGGATLVRIDNQGLLDQLDELLKPTLDRLTRAHFKGLVSTGLKLDTSDGRLGLEGLTAGWPFLATHAFLSELEDFGGALRGATPHLPRKYVTVVPLSLPPWPFGAPADPTDPQRIAGLSPQQAARVFWHEVQIRQEPDEGARPGPRSLWTTGRGGLLGVARGAAGTPDLARALALEIPQRIHLAGLQYRPDIGASVGPALAQIEALFGVVL